MKKMNLIVSHKIDFHPASFFVNHGETRHPESQ